MVSSQIPVEWGRYAGISGRFRAVVFGTDDTRVRATWRVLLAMPVFWILGGGVFTGNLQAAVGALPDGGDPLGGVTASLLHGGFVLVVLVGWARYLDRMPLSSYGVSLSRDWLRDLVVGFAAIFTAFAAWFAAASALGWARVDVALTAPDTSVLAGVGLFVVALGIHVWIQQVVFFRIVVKNAAEGLHNRGLDAPRAVFGGVVVAVPIFIAMHQLQLDLRVADLLVVGLIYGLVYAHTSELALGIGLHLGIFIADQTLFVAPSRTAEGVAVFQVTQSLPGPLQTLATYGFPKMLLAYALVVTYLYWRHGAVPLGDGIVPPDVAS